jgi:hypothetical protein
MAIWPSSTSSDQVETEMMFGGRMPPFHWLPEALFATFPKSPRSQNSSSMKVAETLRAVGAW